MPGCVVNDGAMAICAIVGRERGCRFMILEGYVGRRLPHARPGNWWKPLTQSRSGQDKGLSVGFV